MGHEIKEIWEIEEIPNPKARTIKVIEAREIINNGKFPKRGLERPGPGPGLGRGLKIRILINSN